MGLIRGSKYCDFSVTDDVVELSYKLWPIVKGIIMTNVYNWIDEQVEAKWQLHFSRVPLMVSIETTDNSTDITQARTRYRE